MEPIMMLKQYKSKSTTKKEWKLLSKIPRFFNSWNLTLKLTDPVTYFSYAFFCFSDRKIETIFWSVSFKSNSNFMGNNNKKT